MTIAVDFDGTIVEHRYPGIGREKPMTIETLKRLAECCRDARSKYDR